MQITTRDWALAVSMIEKLRQRCHAHDEMFGTLLYHLVKAGILTQRQGEALNAEWDQSCEALEEFNASSEIERISETGVSKSQESITLDRAFAALHADALDHFLSDD
jgi:hypothetical protein